MILKDSQMAQASKVVRKYRGDFSKIWICRSYLYLNIWVKGPLKDVNISNVSQTVKLVSFFGGKIVEGAGKSFGFFSSSPPRWIVVSRLEQVGSSSSVSQGLPSSVFLEVTL
mmetsp:Transcript_37976/g.51378  ORF Transcript_37976/g.51378 Transcript_37976/m.51378 type:complete len:112 (-) Transcript_37976:285-620(-)